MPTPNPTWRADVEIVKSLLRDVRRHDSGEDFDDPAQNCFYAFHDWERACDALSRLESLLLEKTDEGADA